MPFTLEGIYVPIVTPFDSQGQVDTNTLRTVVRSMLAAGVHGLVAAGTTGEGYALSFDERRHVLNHVVVEVNGEVPVLAGVGGMSTHEALDQAMLAKRAGVNGLMLAAPSYCLPTETELAAHVKTVAVAIDLPTVLYDYPARTGVTFSRAVLDLVVELPQVVGIKEASGDLSRLEWLIRDFKDSLTIVCGSDVESLSFLNAGVTCWIGGIANLLPEAHVAMLDPSQRQTVYSAILPTLELIESGDYNAKIKAGMALRGLSTGSPRAPLTTVSPKVVAALAASLDSAGTWAPMLVD
jgi:4-hydroxy-tetrahydrodipicolinate synthase